MGDLVLGGLGLEWFGVTGTMHGSKGPDVDFLNEQRKEKGMIGTDPPLGQQRQHVQHHKGHPVH